MVEKRPGKILRKYEKGPRGEKVGYDVIPDVGSTHPMPTGRDEDAPPPTDTRVPPRDTKRTFGQIEKSLGDYPPRKKQDSD